MSWPLFSTVIATLVVTPMVTFQPSAATAAQAADDVNDDARVMAAFTRRVEEYRGLREKVARQLPRGEQRRDESTTPEKVVAHQRALAAGLRAARAAARPGDIFTPDAQAVLRRLLVTVFKKQRGGASAKATVNEDNPRGAVKVAVNQSYADGAPLSTMPPDVLNNLPRLPEAIQYHFVGRTLILLDSDARLIVDYMPDAMP